MTQSGNERGSTSAVLLVALLALGLSLHYISLQQRKSSNLVKQAKLEGLSADANSAAASTISQVKALLNEGKLSAGAYATALFPMNYFDAVWTLGKHPAIDSTQVNLAGNQDFKIKTLNAGNDDIHQAAAIFNGTMDQLNVASRLDSVKMLKANFDPSGRLAESVDIEVTSVLAKGNDGKVVRQKARVPLTAPLAHHPILEFRLAGTASWIRNPSALARGSYDIRVLGSGVVVEALVNVNGGPDIVLGGFDSATGTIKHKAVNVLAKDEVIGQTEQPYSLNSGSSQTDYTIDSEACTMTPVGGKFIVSAKLLGPDGTIGPDGEASLEITVDGSGGQTLSEDQLKGMCGDACPYVNNQPLNPESQALAGLSGNDANTVSFYRWQQLQKSAGTDYSWSHNYDFNVKLNVFDVKICENISKPIAAAWQKTEGKPGFADLSQHLDQMEYTFYRSPSCQRQFLFVRKACGCFAEETQILLGDQKSSKKISDLTPEDQVWNPIAGKAYAIDRLTRGPESLPMIHIQTKQGNLVVTGNHPFPTPEGIVRAFQLRIGQEILDAERNLLLVEDIALKREARDPVVWNLVLKGSQALEDHFVVANGVVTGDLFIQAMQTSVSKSFMD